MKIHKVKSGTIIVFVTLLFLAGCKTVDIYSQRNPQWHGEPLKKVMVIGNFENLVYRNYAEGQMCEYVNDFSDTECLQSLKYLFVGQNQSAQLSDVLNREKVDGVIYISTQAHGTRIVNMPMVFTTTWSAGFANTIGYGGPVSVDWANYSVKLYAPNDTVIWYANTDASGKPENTIEHSSYTITRELVKAGIIIPGGSDNYRPQ